MKKLIVIGLFLSSTLYGAESLYKAKEYNVSLFGGIKTKTFSDADYGTGVGLSYFITKNIGLGVDAWAQNTHSPIVDYGALSLIGRLPINNSAFSPYFQTGVGRDFESDQFSWHSEGGVELRFTKHLGVFSGIRAVVPENRDNHIMIRLGANLSF